MNEIVNTDYANWLQAISKRYRRSQIKAAVAVNAEMLKFYFGLGRDIVRMEKNQPWGNKFLQKLGFDLRTAMPEASCFSYTNLRYMRYFFKLYAETSIYHQVGDKSGINTSKQLGHQVGDQILPQDDTNSTPHEICHQVGDKSYVMNFEEVYPNVAQLIFSVPWRHHIVLIDKFRVDQKAALFYVNEIVKNGWTSSRNQRTSLQSGFSSARRRTTRWSNGR